MGIFISAGQFYLKMARKIRTFREYDAARRERELNLPQVIESKLEQEIKLNINKQQKELGAIAIIAHSADFFKALWKGPEGIMRFYLEQQVKQHAPQAEREATLEYFQQNIRELIGCGVSLSKPYGALNDDQKQSFYARFLDNVKEFTDSKYFAPFKTQYSGIEDLLHGFHPPEREEELSAVATVTEGLCREKYITRENADTIIKLLSSEKNGEAFPVRHLPARGKTPAPVPEQTIMGNEDKSTREERMEYLTMVLRLPPETAQSYANQVTLRQLDELHQGMNDAVGDEYTFKIIQANPRVIMYPSGNLLTKYLTTLQVVQGRIRSNGDKEELERKFGLENNVERYASLEQLLELKRQLFQETGKYHTAVPAENTADDFSVYVSRYALLQKIPVMEQRLDSLIEKGEFTVGTKEHWGERSRKSDGARGGEILRIVKKELNHLFADLGYDSPQCETNFGQNKLSVPPKTQQLLGEIRDRAYQSLKK